MADEPGLRARDLRKPEEPDRPLRRRQGPARDRRPQGAGDLEEGRAPRGVVVGAGRLVTKVSRENHFSGRAVAARDRGAHDVEGRRVHLCRDRRAKDDPLSRREPGSEVLRLPLRHHECKAVVEAVRREVTPADEVAVIAGPRGGLVRKGREKSGRVPLFARKPVNRRKRSVGENDPSGDRLSGVIPGIRPAPDVHELGRNARVLAVVGEGHRKLRERGHETRARGNLLQARPERCPAGVAPEVRVARFPVSRESLDCGIGQAGRHELCLQVFRGRKVAGRTLDAVKPPQRTDRLQDCPPVDLCLNRRGTRLSSQPDLRRQPGLAVV